MEEEEEHGWIMYIDTCINDNYRLVCYNIFCSISLHVMLSLLSDCVNKDHCIVFA